MKSTATNKTKKVRVIPGYHLTLGITVTMLSLIVLIPLASDAGRKCMPHGRLRDQGPELCRTQF